MKPIDKKEMPKLVVLIVLAVGLLGFAIFQFSGGASAGSSPQPAQSAAPTPKPTPSGDPTPEPLSMEFLQGHNTTLGGRDPFEPTGQAAPQKPGEVLHIPKIEHAPAPSTGLQAFLRAARAGAGNPPPGAGPGDTPRTDPVVVAAPPPPAITLVGVIVAESAGRSVAILRQGDERKFLTEGNAVGNDWVIAAIHLDSIELVDSKQPDRRETVKLSQ